MEQRQLGRGGPWVSPIGFGAFKIGRNQKTKYGSPYDLPDEQQTSTLLNGLLDAGINYIDTAPSYGLSEQRIGAAVAHRRHEYTLSTKVGETIENGVSTYDFSRRAIEESVQKSLHRLQTDVLDLVFIHSDGNDVDIIEQSDAVATLSHLRQRGAIRRIGMSATSVAGIEAALPWADAVMVTYNIDDASVQAAIATSAAAGIGVVVKKGLASGTLDAQAAIRFVLADPNVSALVVGTLSVAHMKQNLAWAGGQC